MKHARTLANRVVLVTGASSGIGRALALELGHAGVRLGVLARRRERLESLADELAHDTDVVVLPCDVTDEAGMSAQCRQARRSLRQHRSGDQQRGVVDERAASNTPT